MCKAIKLMVDFSQKRRTMQYAMHNIFPIKAYSVIYYTHYIYYCTY